MTTQFPAGIDSFDIRSPQEIIRAMHVNDIQEAIVAIEVFLLGLNQSFNNHVTQTADAHDASAISVAPSPTLISTPWPITATTVQAALEQLKLVIIEVSQLETDLAEFVTHLNADINTAHPGSILGSKIADNTITIDKLAFDIATQLELDEHTGTDINIAHPGLILGSKIADATIAIEKLNFDVATQIELDAHINSLTAHNASQIVVSPGLFPTVGGQPTVTVQTALSTLKTAIDAHIAAFENVHGIADSQSGSTLIWPLIQNAVVGRLDRQILEEKSLVSQFQGSKIVLFTNTVEDLEKEIFAPYTGSASDSQIVVRRPSASTVTETTSSGTLVSIPVVNSARFITGDSVRVRLAPNYNPSNDILGTVSSVSGSNVNVSFTSSTSIPQNSLLINDTTENPLFEVGSSGAVKIQNLTVAAGQSFQDNVFIAKNLTVQGSTTLGVGGTDTTTIVGSLIHTGSGSTSGNYSVAGLLTAGSVVTGDIGSSGLTTLNNVSITGALTVGAPGGSGSNLSITGDLTVDGYALFNQSVSANNFTAFSGLYNNINLPQFRAEFDSHLPNGNQLPVFQAGFQHHTDQLAYSSTRVLADTLPLGAAGIVEQARFAAPYQLGDTYISVERIGTFQVGDTVIVGDGYFGFALPSADPWPAVITTETNGITNVPSGVGLQNLDSATSATGYQFTASHSRVTAITTQALSRLVSGNGLLVGEIWSVNGSNNPATFLHQSINSISVSSLSTFTTDNVDYNSSTFNFTNAQLVVGQKYFFVARYLSYTSGSASGAASTVGFTLPTSNGSTNGIGSQFTPNISSAVTSVQTRLAQMTFTAFDMLSTTTTYSTSSWLGLSYYLAATFTPSASVQISSIDILLTLQNTTGSLYVEVYAANGSNIPTGSVLGTSTLVSIPTVYTPAGNVTVRFSFASPISLAASTKYIWILKSSGVPVEPYSAPFSQGDTNANTTPRYYIPSSNTWGDWGALESRFAVNQATSGSITASIYTVNGSGVPNTLLGSSSTVSISSLPVTTPDWVSFTFSSNVSVTAGQEYALVFTWLIPSGQYIKYEYGSYVAGMDLLSTTNGSTWSTFAGQTLRFNVTMSSGSVRVSGRQVANSTYGASTSTYPSWTGSSDVLDISLSIAYVESGYTHARTITDIDPFAIPPRIYLDEYAGLDLLTLANEAKIIKQVAWNSDLPNNVTDALDTLAGHLYDHINKGLPYPSHSASHVVTEPFNFTSPFYTPASNMYGVQDVQLVLDQFGQRLYQHLDGYQPNGLGTVDGYYIHYAKDLGYDNSVADIRKKYPLLSNASSGTNIVSVPLVHTMKVGDEVRLSDDLPFAPESFTITNINVASSEITLSGNLGRNYLTTNNSVLSNYTIETVQEALEALATSADISLHINDGYQAHNVTSIGITGTSGMPGFSATNAAQAFVELAGADWNSTTHPNLYEHIFDLGAHPAQNITFDGSLIGSLTSPYTGLAYPTSSYNDVQEALDGVQKSLYDHVDIPIDAHDASAISIAAFTSTYFGPIGSVNANTYNYIPTTVGSSTLLPNAGKVAQTFTGLDNYLNAFSVRMGFPTPTTGTIVARLYEAANQPDINASFIDTNPSPSFYGPTTTSVPDTYSALTGVGLISASAAIECIAVYNGEVYIGGSSTQPSLLKWNGSAFVGVGSFNGSVYALKVYNGELYIGGGFTDGGGITGANGVVKYNGSAFSLVGAPGALGSSWGRSFEIFGSHLYIGTMIVPALFKWDGANITNVANTFSGQYAKISSLKVFNSQLYVGGYFLNGAGVSGADSLLKYNGTTFSTVPSANLTGGDVWCMEIFNQDLYIGGGFNNGGGVSGATNIVKYNGTSFSLAGPANTFNSYVSSFQIYNGDLYVGGKFSTVAGVSGAKYIVKYDGTQFNLVGTGNELTTGTYQGVHAIGVFANQVYVGGYFRTINGVSGADFITKFTPGYSRFGLAAGENIGQGITGYTGYLKNFTVFISSNAVAATTLTANVYSRDPSTGLPTGSSLATSVSVNLSTITPTVSQGSAVVFNFPTPAHLNGQAFIVVVSQSGATNLSYRRGGSLSTQSGYVRDGVGGNLIAYAEKFDHSLIIEPFSNYSPTGPQLTQTTINASGLLGNPQLLSFIFDTPHLLDAAKTYTLIVENLSSQAIVYYSNTLDLPANDDFRLVAWSGSWLSSSTTDLEFSITTSDQVALSSTNVQQALQALQGQLDDGYAYTNNNLNNHLVDSLDAHDASAISIIPFNNMTATEVQAALQQWHPQGDLTETAVNILNNQVAPSDITGLLFNTTVVRSAHIDYSIYRYHLTPTVELASAGTLRLIYKPQSALWILDDTFAGDNVGVTFSVTPAGQVQYTSTDLGSAPQESVIKFRVRVTGA